MSAFEHAVVWTASGSTRSRAETAVIAAEAAAPEGQGAEHRRRSRTVCRRGGRVEHRLTRTSVALVWAITGLSVAHHVDHLLRDVTGSPLEGGFNPFTISLFVYPVIGAGLVLSRFGRVGPRFWAGLAGGGTVFVAAVHVRPLAGDSVTDIPGQHASDAGDVAALAILAALVGALAAHCMYEARRLRRGAAR